MITYQVTIEGDETRDVRANSHREAALTAVLSSHHEGDRPVSVVVDERGGKQVLFTCRLAWVAEIDGTAG